MQKWILVVVMFVPIILLTACSGSADGGAGYGNYRGYRNHSSRGYYGNDTYENDDLDLPSNRIVLPEGYLGFPSLHIVSEYDPFDVERDFWHDGVLALSGTHYDFDHVPLRVRGRGNSTWFRGPEKRPLRLRFPEARTMFASEYAHRDWVLVANLFDPSLVRNYSAFYLARLLDNLDFTPSCHFVHLYVNGGYKGLYQLLDERDPSPGRGPLTFDPDPTKSEYLFELDGHLVGWREDEFELDVDFFVVGEGEQQRAYDIRYPRQNDWNGHLEYLRDFVQHAHAILQTRDYYAISQVIDIPSFVDFYLVQEFMKNIDVGEFSVFMTLRGQGDERRIHFGPVWDFDRSAGNTLYWTEYGHPHAAIRNYWFRNMLATPEIFDIVATRWNEINSRRGPISQTINHIADITSRYEESFLRNFEVHDHILGQEPGQGPDWFEILPIEVQEIDSFPGQIEYLMQWYAGRVWWLDAFFNRRYDWINEWWDDVVDGTYEED